MTPGIYLLIHSQKGAILMSEITINANCPFYDEDSVAPFFSGQKVAIWQFVSSGLIQFWKNKLPYATCNKPFLLPIDGISEELDETARYGLFAWC